MAIIIKGSKSNKHNIIGGLQSFVEQVQRLAPPGHFAKTINISEYPEYSGEMIFFADTDGIAQINSKELEVVDPKMPEDKIASDFEMGYAASKIFAQTLGATKGKKSLPERVTEYYHRVTRPEPWLPSYSAFRPLDVAYQCAQSAEKKYLLGVLYEWVYVEGRKVIVFTMWPQNTFDIEILLYTLGIPFVSIKSLTHQTAKQREDAATKFNTEEACKVLVR
ncbi:hypothetical protein D6D02_05790 [Aureobasidium pullulans]|uniref:Uncharacterized protein n=1 Tax=Aureobasidium pullulans TaxID=5580 RepID=A0A4S9K6Z4_AURPU|nr:hypothetical protein D6D02_05790 [Aureobasidium pullulans]TIA33558.1 hypothetical protein D6C78_07461 [Aureobasidium pullulans]